MKQIYFLIAITFLSACKRSPDFRQIEPSSSISTPEVSSTPPTEWELVEEQFIQGEVLQEFNLLFVIDNSESMASVREFVRTNLERIIEPLALSRHQLDFRIGVTITDPEGRKPGLFRTRRQIPYVGGRSPLSQPDLQRLQADWNEILEQIQPTRFRGWEQGLKASESSLMADWSQFARRRAHLAVIWLTDEDDYSSATSIQISRQTGDVGALYPENHRDRWQSLSVNHYLDFFAQVEKSIEADVLLYPIIHANPERGPSCQQSAPSVSSSVGGRYLDLVAGWPRGKAQALSICAEDLESSFDRIAALTADRDLCFTLTSPLERLSVKVGKKSIPESQEHGFYVKNEGEVSRICFAQKANPRTGEEIEVAGLRKTAK